MKKFSQFNEEREELTEKFGFIPKSVDNIQKADIPVADELAQLYLKVTQETDMDDPIAVNFDDPRKVKIHRSLEGAFDVKELSKEFGLNVSYGNGSRGNLGANNRGNIFEKVLLMDIELYAQTRDLGAEYTYPDFMREFASRFLSKHTNITAKQEGGLNKPRPLQFSGSTPTIQSSRMEDIGPTVTDVTVMGDKTPYYLSLKLGSTITLFNVGVTKYLTKDDIKRGEVTNPKGRALLDLFGIDYDRYVQTFGRYDASSNVDNKPDYVNTMSKLDRRGLERFLATGIGYGYFFVHAKNAKPGAPIHYAYMDKQTAQNSIKPLSVQVKYPTPGAAKRIDILIETPMFYFKVNIRNKQGGVAPSHIMCDYKFK